MGTVASLRFIDVINVPIPCPQNISCLPIPATILINLMMSGMMLDPNGESREPKQLLVNLGLPTTSTALEQARMDPLTVQEG